MTFKTILREMRDIPAERLEELYQYVHSLNPKSKRTNSLRKQILSFAEAFSDMSNKDYKDFLKQTIKTRSKLFERKFNV